MRRTGALALVLATLLIGVVGFLLTDPPDSERDTRPPDKKDGEEPGAPLLGGEGSETPSEPRDPAPETQRKSVAITGRVVSAATGEPVEGVTVVLARYRTRPVRLGTAVSGRDGAYVVRVAEEGEMLVYALGAGWMSDELDLIPRGGYSPHVFPVRGPATVMPDIRVVKAARITGQILDDDGAPIEGAEIAFEAASPDDMEDFPLTITTVKSGAKGRFTFDALPPGGPFFCTANRDAGYSETTDPLRLVAGETHEVVIRAPRVLRGRWLEVEVLGAEEGEPLRNVLLDPMYLEGSEFTRGDLRGGFRTDDDGKARLVEMCSRPMAVRVFGYHYIEPDVNPVRVEADDTAPGVQVLTIRLGRGKTIKGRVRLPAGVRPDAVEISLIPPFESPDRGRRWSLQVQADGTFEQSGLHPGRYRLRGFGNGVKDFERHVEAGSPEIVIPLEPAPLRRTDSTPTPRVGLRIVGPDGVVVAKARYLFFDKYGPDASGEYRGPVTSVEIFEPDEIAGLEVWGAADGSGRPLSLASARLGAVRPKDGEIVVRMSGAKRVSGRVVGPSGEPIAGALVEATVDLRETEADYDAPVHAKARTKADGTFSLDGLGNFSYLVRARVGPKYVQPAAVPLELPAKDDLVLRQRAGLRPTFTVLDWRGQPVSGAIVIVGQEDAPFDGYFWGSREHMRAEEVSPKGSYLLDVPLDPEIPHELYVYVPKGTGRVDLYRFSDSKWAPVADMRVVIPRGGYVSGVVVDADGKPVAGREVTAAWDGDDEWEKTDDEGRFSILVAWGPVELTVDGSSAAAVRTRAGESDIRITLAR